MPNLLLFGCHEELVHKLASDDRWSIAIGEHGDFSYAADDPPIPNELAFAPPDPRHWNLIVDDHGHDNAKTPHNLYERYGLRGHYIPDKYLRECDRAHAIQLCTGKPHFRVGQVEASGYKTIEFNAARQPEAMHIVDFIDEFEASFSRTALSVETSYYERKRWPSEFVPLFFDAYGEPVIALYRGALNGLFLIDIPNVERRIEALRYLCCRTAPKLWPDIYSDSFEPKRVVSLLEERDKAIAERRALERQLEEEIQKEQGFYAPFVNLLYIGDDALKQLVHRVFAKVFGFGVDDLDERLEKGEPKGLDLRVEFNDNSAFIEVRGSGTRNARVSPDIERLYDNYKRSSERFSAAQGKALVFNGMYLRSAEERARNPAFSDDVVEESVAHGIALVATDQLLHAVESFRNGELTQEAVMKALLSPGRSQL